MSDRTDLTDDEAALLLDVATLYVKAFSPDELMTLSEKLMLQDVEDLLARHGRITNPKKSAGNPFSLTLSLRFFSSWHEAYQEALFSAKITGHRFKVYFYPYPTPHWLIEKLPQRHDKHTLSLGVPL